MDVIKRTLTRAVLHTEAKITVLREWSTEIHKEGIKVVPNWIFPLAGVAKVIWAIFQPRQTLFSSANP
jgi:hypothetical protein